MLPRISWSLLLKVLLLLLLLVVERVGGLPVWFGFGALSLIQPYDWRTRTILMVGLGVSLSLSYVVPFAVGFGVIWLGVLFVENIEGYVKSPTIRLVLGTIFLLVVMSLISDFQWSSVALVTHMLSLLCVVSMYRLSIAYQVLAPRRLQISQRLQNQSYDPNDKKAV